MQYTVAPHQLMPHNQYFSFSLLTSMLFFFLCHQPRIAWENFIAQGYMKYSERLSSFSYNSVLYFRSVCEERQERHMHKTSISSVGVIIGHLHVMLNALHGDDMQRPVLVCMLLNECLPLFLFACPCFQKTTIQKVGILLQSLIIVYVHIFSWARLIKQM